MLSTRPDGPPGIRARTAFDTLVLVACTVAILPLWPSMPNAGLDGSWQTAINAAVGRHLRFGRDLIFTFGPYASLYTRSYHPATDGLTMVAGTVLVAAFASALLVLGHAPGPGRARGRAFALAAAVALLLDVVLARDALFFLLPLLSLAVVVRSTATPGRCGGRALAALAILTCGLAILPLVKGTFAAGVAICLGAEVLVLAGRRRFALALGTVALFAVAMAAFWVGAGQPVSGLPGFFASQSLIVAGYTQAMGLAGPPASLVAYAAAAIVVLATNLPSARRRGPAHLALLGLAALLLLLGMKAGFVREDEHVVIAAGTLGLVASALALFDPGRLSLVGMLAGVGTWFWLQHAAVHESPAAALRRVAASFEAAGEGLADRLGGGAALGRAYLRSVAAIRSADPLPPLEGGTDIYSDGQSILLANGLSWSPRPIVQSYSAYSPALERLDALHLSSGDAPRNVVFSVQPIDHRLPSLEDGLSWPVLLGRYEAVRMVGEAAVLRRLPGDPADAAIGPAVLSARVALGRSVPIPDPDGGPVWATIVVRPTLLGRIEAAALRPPPVWIAFDLPGGRRARYRLIPGMAEAGFLISPLVDDATEFASLRLPPRDGIPLRRPISFSVEADRSAWSDPVEVTLAPLSVVPLAGTEAALFHRPAPPVAASAPSGPGRCWLDQADGRTIDPSRPLRLSRLATLTGWGFGRDSDGAVPVEPERDALVLRRDGAMLEAPATLGSRGEVGIAFHDPDLQNVGFRGLLDLGGLSGRYTLSLRMEAGGQEWLCDLVREVDIAAPSPVAPPPVAAR